MNILFPYLARWRSANWSRFHSLLGALCRQGHHVYVLEAPPRRAAQETNYTEASVPLPEGMTVQQVPVPLWNLPFPLEKLVKKGLLTLATRRFVARALREERIDVLFLYNLPQLILVPADRGRCQVVFDVADDLLAMFAHEAGRWAPLLSPAAAWFFQRLAEASDWVTTPSSVMAGNLPGRVRILPNGADLPATRKANGQAIRARYTPPIVGFVGAFEYCVDFDLLLDTAALLPQATFLLVGAGRQWPHVRQAVCQRGLSNVILIGAVPYPANLDYIQAMDICLIPRAPGRVSDHATPLKLFEYAALAKPIVATPMRETEAIAVDYVNFAADARATADLIERILADPATFRARAQRGQESTVSTYNWDQIAAEFVRLLGNGS